MNTLKSIRILLVEDSPSDVRLIQEALKNAPVTVHLTIARDGVEATDYLDRTVNAQLPLPDLMLLDINLPRKHGWEVLAEVKSNPLLRHVPVLVMTSSKADEDVLLAYSLNANCYIPKPADLTDYVNVITALEDFWFVTASLPDTPLTVARAAAAGL